MHAIKDTRVGCFIIDPPMGLTQPSAQQDWMDTAWTLHDTVNTLALATVNFPTAKFILYTTFSLGRLQAEMDQQKVTGLAVSHFVVMKVRLLSYTLLAKGVWLLHKNPGFSVYLRTLCSRLTPFLPSNPPGVCLGTQDYAAEF